MQVFILFADGNLACCVRDIVWGAQRKILAVGTLQQDFPTQLFTPYLHTSRAHRMLSMCRESIAKPLESSTNII